MRGCPKCSAQYGDESKICRNCGAILEDVAEEPSVEPADVEPAQQDAPKFEPSEPVEPPATFPTFDQLESGTESADGDWQCPRCGETVPWTFDVCWKCGSDKEAPPDVNPPGAHRRDALTEGSDEAPPEVSVPEVRPAGQPEWAVAAPVFQPEAQPQCPACGSTEMMRGLRVVGQEHAPIQVVVYGDPDALIFKDARYAELTADVCGRCGHVQLSALNPWILYEHYRESRR